MKKLISHPLYALLILLLVVGCNRNKNQSFPGVTTVEVKEIIQVPGYTYLLVKEKGPEFWIAASKMDVKQGEIYHYDDGMVMENFHSKELDRTFEKVVFVTTLTKGKPGQASAESNESNKEWQTGSSVSRERVEVAVPDAAGTVTVGELFEDPAAYKGKVIRVTGKVTGFNAAIMERNWIHLQDGTEYEGKFDLVATSNESFEEGEMVTLEGVVAVDLDFGYGYTYEVLLESAASVSASR
jgi:hypothetical protein